MINNSNNVSFCGATRWFKKELFINKSSIDNIINSTNSEFVGTLPREIIQDIVRVSKNKEDKIKRIKNIMDGFSSVSQSILALRGKLEKYGCYWESNSSFKNKKFIKVIEKNLNKVFRKGKLIKFGEKIRVETLGEGGFGDVFLIRFPERKQYQPLVLKLFRYSGNSEFVNFCNHGALAENNIMIRLNDLFKKLKEDAIHAKGFFGSLKNAFLVSEYVSNKAGYTVKHGEFESFTAIGEKCCYEISETLKKVGLAYTDYRPSNIIGGKLVDYGGIQDMFKKYSKPESYYNY